MTTVPSAQGLRQSLQRQINEGKAAVGKWEQGGEVAHPQSCREPMTVTRGPAASFPSSPRMLAPTLPRTRSGGVRAPQPCALSTGPGFRLYPNVLSLSPKGRGAPGDSSLPWDPLTPQPKVPLVLQSSGRGQRCCSLRETGQRVRAEGV